MAGKVPIPRLAAPQDQRNPRTLRACQPCRDQKCKCSGDQPVCRQCESAGRQCFYREPRRQLMERELQELRDQLQACRALLQEIQPELGSDSAGRVQAILSNSATETINSYSPGLGQPSSTSDKEASSENDAQKTVADFTEEDFNQDSRSQATGFLGGHSEIAWLYRLRRELEQSQLATAGQHSGLQDQRTFRDSITTMNYSVDESDLPIDMSVDVFGVPPKKIADDLIHHYFHIVYPTFPIISQTLFMKQFWSFYSEAGVRPGKRWLAILNLIFAIASRYRGLAYNDSGRGDYHDDLIYFCRAWKLNTADFALANHPDLQQVQVEGLTSFYLLSIGQVNRSWRFCGLSMRSAITMGIHLRNESPHISPISKENRCWVWWSLYTLDITLCLKTGRGPSVNTEFITAPLPQPFGKEAVRKCQNAQNSELSSIRVTVGTRLERDRDDRCDFAPDTSRYFLSFVQLTLLMRRSIESLYAPAGSKDPWHIREDITMSLNTKLNEWASQLLPELQFEDPTAQYDTYIRQRVSLAFRFYSTKLLLLQPSLHRATKQPSSELCKQLADACVEAAYEMLSLFPDYPSTSWLYDISPWWCTLHYLMQSLIVFLMKLQHEKRKGLVTADRLAYSVEKSVRWLRDMSTRDPPSGRAWEICKEIIVKHFPVFVLEPNFAN